MKIVVLFAFYLISIQVAYSQIRINEVCSSNSESLYDEDSETPDWIELYNYSNKPVNLSDWSISDQTEYSNAWQLPDTTIQPGQFFLIYASGKGRYTSGYYAMNMKSRNSITNFDYYEEYRYRYKEISGDFRSTLEIKSMNNEKLWGLVGIKIQDTLSDVTNFFSTFATAKEKGGYFAYKREKKSDYSSYIPLYGVVNLPYSKIGLDRRGDTLFTYYYNRLGEIYKQEKYPNFLPEKIYWGVSVSSENPDLYGQFVVDNLVLDGDTIDINTLDVHEETTSEAGYDYDYNECHSDFSIKGGETIYLYSESNIVDSVETFVTASDITHVYYEGEWGITDDPTPGLANTSIYLGRVPKPIIEYENGVVTIKSDEDTDVYYTLDYSLPSKEDGILYNAPIILENGSLSTINAQSYKEKYVPSFNSSRLFGNFNSNFKIPIVAISLDGRDLNGPYGLLSGFGIHNESRYKARFEYFENGKSLLRKNIEIKIHGQSTKSYSQKSFRIYSDNNNDKAINNIFFNNTKINHYDQLVLRNSGQDWKETYIKDAFNSLISKEYDANLVSNYRPVWLILNGENYGLLNLRERIENDFISNSLNTNKEYINITKPDYVFNNYDFDLFYQLINTKFSDNKEGYKLITELTDTENVIDYFVHNIYTVNTDWPHLNFMAFTIDGQRKVRFILKDLDMSFSANNRNPDFEKLNSLDEDYTTELGQLFNNLINNNRFKIEFINRYCDLMNTVFLPKNLNQLLDSLANNIRPIIPLQQELWPESVVNWEDELLEMKRFINERPYYAIRYLDNELNNTSGIAQLNLTSFPSNAGSFKVNSLDLDMSEWSGKYLQKVPVTITALPKHGYKFKKWNIDSLGTSASISTTLSEIMIIKAIYEELDPTADTVLIVINEIMYNADKDKDTKDWVELYNAGNISVDLNGWSLIDEDDTHTPFVISNDVIIEPDEYIIFTRNKTDFEALIDIENQVIGDFDYGFGGNDIVILKDAQGNTHDSVNYDNNLPWPEGADGTGYTIELINPFLDNNVASNWEISQPELGTPGLINSVYDDSISSISINADEAEVDFVDNQLFVFSKQPIESLKLFDVNGRNISIEYKISIYRAESDLNHISDGLYFVNIKYLNGNEETLKLIVD